MKRPVCQPAYRTMIGNGVFAAVREIVQNFEPVILQQQLHAFYGRFVKMIRNAGRIAPGGGKLLFQAKLIKEMLHAETQREFIRHIDDEHATFL